MIILNISTNAMSLKGLEVWKTEILEGNCSANIKIIFSAKIHAKEIFHHKIGYKKNHYIRQIQSPEVMIFFKISLKITCILLAFEGVISYM